MTLTLNDDINSQWFRIEMSSAKQYFDDWLISIKQQDCSFSITEERSNHSKHMKGFSITRGSNIFGIRSGSYILAERLCQDQLENDFGDKF